MTRYTKIENWINSNHFPDRQSVESYISIHGGKSSGMDSALDFIFGNTGNLPEFIELQPVTPLESLQGVREPTTLQEVQQEREVEEVKDILQQAEGTAPDTQDVEQQQSVVRRLRRFLGAIFGGQ